MSTTVGKRKNIKHFDEMSHKDFVALMREAEGNEGYLMIDVNMKLDGCLTSFGMDEDNRIWVKTGKSDKIYNVGDFFHYTRKRNFYKNLDPEEFEKVSQRAKEYDTLLETLQRIDVGLTPGSYLVGEMFNAHMATHHYNDSKSRFVNLWYDSNQFKKDYVFYIYEANILNVISGREFEFRDPKIFSGDIQIDPFIMSIWLGHRYDLAGCQLNEYYKWIARNMKRDIAEKIFKHGIINERAYQLGACEGIVIRRILDADNKQFKIITPEFREMVKKS